MTTGAATQAAPASNPEQWISSGLERIENELRRNPAYLDKAVNVPRVSLRQDTPSGGKFWTGTLSGRNVLLTWGRMNTAGANKTLPRHTSLEALTELRGRVMSKLGKGYVPIINECKLP
jgi:predicted DNA-binding WGR domain protein